MAWDVGGPAASAGSGALKAEPGGKLEELVSRYQVQLTLRNIDVEKLRSQLVTTMGELDLERHTARLLKEELQAAKARETCAAAGDGTGRLVEEMRERLARAEAALAASDNGPAVAAAAAAAQKIERLTAQRDKLRRQLSFAQKTLKAVDAERRQVLEQFPGAPASALQQTLLPEAAVLAATAGGEGLSQVSTPTGARHAAVHATPRGEGPSLSQVSTPSATAAASSRGRRGSGGHHAQVQDAQCQVDAEFAQGDVAPLREQLRQLREELEAVSSERNQLLRDIVHYRAMCDEREAQAADLRKALANELDDEKKAGSTRLAELEALRQRHDSVCKEHSTLEAQVEEQQRNHIAIQAERDRLVREAQFHKSVSDERESAFQEIEQLLHDKALSHASLAREHSGLASKHGALSREKGELEMSLTSAQARTNALASERDQLLREKQQLQAAVRDSSEASSEAVARATLAAAEERRGSEAELERARAESSRARRERENLERELAASRERQQTLVQELKAAEAQKAQMPDDYQELKRSAQLKLRTALDEERKAKALLVAELEDLRERHEEATAECRNYPEELREAYGEAGTARGDLVAARSEWEREWRALHRLHEEAQDQASDRDTLAARLVDAETKCASESAESQRLRREVQTLSVQVEHLRTDDNHHVMQRASQQRLRAELEKERRERARVESDMHRLQQRLAETLSTLEARELKLAQLEEERSLESREVEGGSADRDLSQDRTSTAAGDDFEDCGVLDTDHDQIVDLDQLHQEFEEDHMDAYRSLRHGTGPGVNTGKPAAMPPQYDAKRGGYLPTGASEEDEWV